MKPLTLFSIKSFNNENFKQIVDDFLIFVLIERKQNKINYDEDDEFLLAFFELFLGITFSLILILLLLLLLLCLISFHSLSLF